ncbi:hypothetical protein AHiyo4_21940 [Arthrobacter sp. Hiyo4]|nr:hypothetical protein AHiyo4_21940 [Arthrobacter sp. Hiyo4]
MDAGRVLPHHPRTHEGTHPLRNPPDLAALNVFILGDVKLVGGAALILQGIGNRPTADINAGYADSQTIHAVVADMAADYDLAPPDATTTSSSSTTPSTQHRLESQKVPESDK